MRIPAGSDRIRVWHGGGERTFRQRDGEGRFCPQYHRLYPDHLLHDVHHPGSTGISPEASFMGGYTRGISDAEIFYGWSEERAMVIFWLAGNGIRVVGLSGINTRKCQSS